MPRQLRIRFCESDQPRHVPCAYRSLSAFALQSVPLHLTVIPPLHNDLDKALQRAHPKCAHVVGLALQLVGTEGRNEAQHALAVPVVVCIGGRTVNAPPLNSSCQRVVWRNAHARRLRVPPGRRTPPGGCGRCGKGGAGREWVMVSLHPSGGRGGQMHVCASHRRRTQPIRLGHRDVLLGGRQWRLWKGVDSE